MENQASGNISTGESSNEGVASVLLLSLILILLVFLEGFGGTVTNVLSLSYFLKKDRKSLASKLMILLNTTDILVCISAFIVFVLMILHGFGMLEKQILLIIAPWFQLLVGATAFSTVLLSITRTISLWRPFYEINQKGITLSIALYWLYVLTMYFLVPRFDERVVGIYSVVELTISILIVATCSVLCVVKLRSNNNLSNTDSTRRRATVTILLISVLFCIVNTAYVVGIIYTQLVLMPMFKRGNQPADLYMIFLYTTFVGVPLNSTINPLIYFTRKKEMRTHINTTCLKFWCCCSKVKLSRKETGTSQENRTQKVTEMSM